MNERLAKLTEQCYEYNETMQGTWFNKTKFAELIVKECIQVCEPVLDEPYEDMSEFGKGLVEGQDVAVEKIKKHFGVEE